RAESPSPIRGQPTPPGTAAEGLVASVGSFPPIDNATNPATASAATREELVLGDRGEGVVESEGGGRDVPAPQWVDIRSADSPPPSSLPAPRPFDVDDDSDGVDPFPYSSPSIVPTLDLSHVGDYDLDGAATLGNSALAKAIGPWCDCCKLPPTRPEDYPPLPEDALSLAGLTQAWNGLIPAVLRNTNTPLPPPLHRRGMLPRDGTLNDYQAIPWASLLSGPEQPYSLDFAKSEERFLQDPALRDLKLQRTWDIDSCIAELVTLATHKHAFNLSYCPSFPRRITQNQR
ncbi:MAG: hypothetical protein LQ341_007841, partial [Variospora aurantia]